MKRVLFCGLLICLCNSIVADDSLAFASGSWFNPERNGEGFVVQVMPGEQAVVTWFTYPPTGEESSQAWLIGSGSASGNRIYIDNVVRPIGGVFGPEFDPQDVVREPWGTLEMVFADCDRAVARWDGPSAFGSGSMELVRLSAIHDASCDANASDSRERIVSGRSGAWFDPAHDGEGWMLETLPDGRMVAYWFTYDDQSRQAWMIGSASLEGRTLWIENLLITGGARFGEDFRADDVTLERWGSLGFLFDQCTTARMRYGSADDRFGEGTLAPVQLAGLASTSCNDPPPAEPLSNGTWRFSADTDSAFSESASAAAGGYVYTGGGYGHLERLQRFDPVTEVYQDMPDMPEERHHPMIASDSQQIYVAGGYTGRFSEVPGDNFWRFDPATSQWEILPDMPDPRAAGAAVHFHGHIMVVGGTGVGIRLLSYDIASGEWSSYPGDIRVPRDHIRAVVFENEIWWMGGRVAEGPGGSTSNGVIIWNPVTREWREGPAMMFARSGFAAGVVDGQIVVAAGERIDVVPPQLIPTLEVFAPGADSWVPGPVPPVVVHGASGAVVDGQFILTAGSDEAGSLSTNRATQILTFSQPAR